MKWYRWKDRLINLKNIFGIYKSFQTTSISFLYSPNDYEVIEYYNEKERDAEFEKICALLGCEEKTQSRCC